MPRKARVDYPGALHHVMARGFERNQLFFDKQDYNVFLEKLEKSLTAGGTCCYAWALIPNHFDLLLVTGEKPISRVMQSLLTGYAMYYNRRYERSGYVYENRYKSILCDREDYFLELIRYIHLNPLRAGLIGDLDKLRTYPWCGHSAVLGQMPRSWQQTDEVLLQFGEQVGKAREAYLRFVADGVSQSKCGNFVEGNMVRGEKGLWDGVWTNNNSKEAHDGERIMGNNYFIEKVLRLAEEKETEQTSLRRRGIDIDYVLNKAAKIMGVNASDICERSRQKNITMARSMVCKWLVEELGMKTVDVARKLGITIPAVNVAVKRGRELVHHLDVRL